MTDELDGVPINPVVSDSRAEVAELAAKLGYSRGPDRPCKQCGEMVQEWKSPGGRSSVLFDLDGRMHTWTCGEPKPEPLPPPKA